MTRLRLWLARLLLPRGWMAICIIPPTQQQLVERYAALLNVAVNMEEPPRADTLGQDDVDGV